MMLARIANLCTGSKVVEDKKTKTGMPLARIANPVEDNDEVFKFKEYNN